MKRPVTTVARRGAAPAASGTQPADRTATAPRLFLADLDAVLFDLDGVLTDTASLHEAAWAQTFAELFDGIAARPPLRVDRAQAIDTIWLLMDPAVFDRLTTDRAWSTHSYGAWFTDSALRLLTEQ